ncbi:MAG: PKD domain-containing protein [Bacteroidia bacterium]
MKTKTTLMLISIISLMPSITAQAQSGSTLLTIEPRQSAEEKQAVEYFLQKHPNREGYAEFVESWRKRSDQNNTQQKTVQPPSTQASCTNVDFEQGNLGGWTSSTGYNPQYISSGCCPSPGGAQAITTGAGVDPCGGFPVVCPGGTYSLKLGNNAVGGVADRIEQTFQVTTGNTNFTYKYAVVLEDPGHSVADQPSFQIDMVDANGNPIPCTYYQVSAGQGIPGFQNSPNCPGVIFKPWTTVSVDLSGYIGQSVTIRFTTYDCGLGGHYGYAYIDGSCSPLAINQSHVLCSNGFTTLCAPAGFASYTWNGPGVTNTTGQCLVVTNGGTYSVQMTSVTGCSSPLINQNVSVIPSPVANFSITNNNGCNTFISFTNNSSASGFYGSYWSFGDGDTSSASSPSHTYASPGTYTVTLTVSNLGGCSDTATGVVTIYPPPAPGMSYTGICEGSPFQFTGILGGNSSGATWLWNFGNNVTSTLQNPAYTFPAPGSYPVTLSVTNNGCTTTIIQNVNVQPKPVVAITSNPVCLGNVTTFTNSTSVAAGTITGWGWDFNNDGQIDNTTQNPVNISFAPGTVTVSLTATSSYGCVATGTTAVTVYNLPLSAFTDVNNCLNANSVFTNNSAAPVGSTISQYFWDFGDGTTSVAFQPPHIYAAPGTFQVSLKVTTNFGCNSTHSDPITVFNLPTVSFTSGSLCASQVAQFNGSVNGGSNGTQWAWHFGNATSNVQNPAYSFPSWGTYNVSLSASDMNGCANTVSQQITIQPAPVVSAAAAPVCLGSASTFTNTSNIPMGSISGWAWDLNGDGVTDNTTQNPSTTYPTSGAHNAVLTVTSAYGCVSTNTVLVTVNALPVAGFAVANACLHTSSNFINTSSAPAGTTLSQFSWTFGNGNSSTQQQPNYTYPNYGTYPVDLTVTTAQGCSASVVNTVTVYPAPSANFSSNPVCVNQNMQFTNLSTIPAGSITAWKWDFNNDGITDATTQNPVNTFTAGGNYNTELTVISNFGCADSIVKPDVVYFNPVANFNASGVCLGNAVQFNDASTNQSGNITVWDWDFTSDGVIDNFSQNTTNTYSTEGLFLVTLQVQNSFGCVNVIKKPVRVNPTPSVNIDVTHRSGCDGEMCVGMINNTSIQGGSVASWQWNFGDGTASNQNSPIHCFHQGTFTVSLTAVSDSGCSASMTLPGSVLVYPKPIADFYFTNTDLDVIDANTGIVSTAQGASGFVYVISDGTHITGQPNFQHTFPNENPQQYTVIQFVSNAFGCKDTIAKVIDIKPGFTFYIPNAFSPNGDGTNDIFKGTGIGIKTYTLMVYDRWGNLVFTSNDLEKGWDGTFHDGNKVSLEDVFVWKVVLRDDSNKEHDYKGTVSLIR